MCARYARPVRARRWRILLPRLRYLPQHEAEFLQPDRPSIRYYRGRMLHAWVNLQLYLYFFEMSITDPEGGVVVWKVFSYKFTSQLVLSNAVCVALKMLFLGKDAPAFPHV